MKFYSALESEDWIVNPYRSTHWDSLCLPAILYNLEKEKQLRCKYLSCLNTEKSTGIPNYMCDQEFGMESCLYLDSAQWHITGGHFWDTVGPGLLKSAMSAALGMAPYFAHDVFCPSYGLDKYGTIATAPLDVACGISGTILQAKEVGAMFTENFWSKMFTSEIPKDPAAIKDYCSGVDYSE